MQVGDVAGCSLCFCAFTAGAGGLSRMERVPTTPCTIGQDICGRVTKVGVGCDLKERALLDLDPGVGVCGGDSNGSAWAEATCPGRPPVG